MSFTTMHYVASKGIDMGPGYFNDETLDSHPETPMSNTKKDGSEHVSLVQCVICFPNLSMGVSDYNWVL